MCLILKPPSTIGYIGDWAAQRRGGKALCRVQDLERSHLVQVNLTLCVPTSILNHRVAKDLWPLEVAELQGLLGGRLTVQQ